MLVRAGPESGHRRGGGQYRCPNSPIVAAHRLALLAPSAYHRISATDGDSGYEKGGKGN